MLKSKKMWIYLAHSPSEQERGLRVQQILEDDGYNVINPFDDQTGSGNDIVRRDISDILIVNVVVCLYPRNLVTVGIDQEMVYANLFRKYVIAYVPDELAEHNIWLQYHTDVVLPPKEEKKVSSVIKQFIGIVETVQGREEREK